MCIRDSPLIVRTTSPIVLPVPLTVGTASLIARTIPFIVRTASLIVRTASLIARTVSLSVQTVSAAVRDCSAGREECCGRVVHKPFRRDFQSLGYGQACGADRLTVTTALFPPTREATHKD